MLFFCLQHQVPYDEDAAFPNPPSATLLSPAAWLFATWDVSSTASCSTNRPDSPTRRRSLMADHVCHAVLFTVTGMCDRADRRMDLGPQPARLPWVAVPRYAGYAFDETDWEAIEAGIQDTDDEAPDGWYSYPLVGTSRSVPMVGNLPEHHTSLNSSSTLIAWSQVVPGFNSMHVLLTVRASATSERVWV
jgi:hypothetical protein